MNASAPASVSSTFARDAYLARLRLASAPGVGEDGLIELTERQLLSIAFENIDPYLFRPVLLDPPALLGKILGQSRGGYCFELNTLLRMALDAFGYQVRIALGRVHGAGTPYGGRTHLLTLVTIGERPWLADCGFGGTCPFFALPLEIGRIEIQKGHAWRFVADADHGYRLEYRNEGWQPLYVFNPAETLLREDIVLGNHFTSTHPDSPFRRRFVLSKTTGRGRIRLVDTEFREETGPDEAIRQLRTVEDLEQVLTLSFGLAGTSLPFAQIASRLKLDSGAGR
ncbi:MAG: arylamine N-acetyltransferase [Geminicoccaceae bacterium]